MDNNKIFLSNHLDRQEDIESDILVEPDEKKVIPPSRYHVLLLNDDFTTMDFVVEILKKFFCLSEEKAVQIMLSIHTHGHAICGTYSKDVAETKAGQVNDYSRQHGHPLLCKVKKVD